MFVGGQLSGGQLSGGQLSGGQLSGGQLSGDQLSGGQLSPTRKIMLFKPILWANFNFFKPFLSSR